MKTPRQYRQMGRQLDQTVRAFTTEFRLLYQTPMDNYATQARYVAARVECSIDDVLTAWFRLWPDADQAWS